MSELSPDEKAPTPPVARRRRPQSKASTPRRAIRPAAPVPTPKSTAEPTAVSPKAAATNHSTPAVPQNAAVQPEPEVVAAPQDRYTWKAGTWTFMSKSILTWAIIVGVGSLIIAVVPGLILSALGVTQKNLDNNPDLEGALGWFTFIVSFGLPIVGGWRATIHEGDWKSGGFTSFWGAVIFTILLMFYYIVYAAVIGALNQINGSFFAGLGEGLITQAILGFGLGAIGGWYSSWQRRRAQRAQTQEMLTPSS